ncbi:MAG TPA: hypothetical protein VFF69_05645, partial [Phycisphaerales bacterium]|nr:hypothetical protein [Phycisphaerales bacterium]
MGGARSWRWLSAATLVAGMLLTIASARVIDRRLTQAAREEFASVCAGADEAVQSRFRRAAWEFVQAAALSGSEACASWSADGASRGAPSVWEIDGGAGVSVRWRDGPRASCTPPRSSELGAAL